MTERTEALAARPVPAPGWRESWAERGFFKIEAFAEAAVCTAMLARVVEIVRAPESAAKDGFRIMAESNLAKLARPDPEGRVAKVFRLHREPVFRDFAMRVDLLDLLTELIAPDL
ncbi:MAG: hypothetical protein ACYDB7_01810, partial [Mycobacteriales bacterium]